MKRVLSISKNRRVDSLTIGKFDGMHIAHQKLFEGLGKNGAILSIDKKRREYLTPPNTKKRYTKYPIYQITLKEVIGLNGYEFMREILFAFPKLKRIIVGYDFRFGKDRLFCAWDLKKIFNGKVMISPEIKLDALPVHTSIIKEFIKFGDVATANRLLGREYEIRGKIIKGQGIGRRSI